MRVEPPRPDEVDELADLWVDLAADQADHGSHLLTDANRPNALDAVRRHLVTGTVFVAREDGVVLGVVTFAPEGGTYERDVERGTVENLYVVPERRGEGIGAALLRAAEEALVEAGAEVVGLDVMAANAAARRFYRRQGYAPHRIRMEKPVAGNDTHTREAD